MGRAPASSRVLEGGLNKGPWTEEEDAILTAFIKANGEGNWRTLPKLAGLQRCRKSCRLRWMNYLRPDLKRGNFSPDEDELIVKLHSLLGNRWSLIAGRIPGRTDNEIKNYWNSRLRRKLSATHGGVLSQRLEATPLSFSEAAVDSSGDEAKLEQSAIASSSRSSTSHSLRTTSFASEPELLFSEAGEAVGPAIFPGDFADDLSPMIFPEYERFRSTGEATPSEPCSSDGTCRDDCSDHQSLEAGYYSTWTPNTAASFDDSLGKDESSFAESVSKHGTYAYSPESVLAFLPQALESGDDDLDLSPSDFADLGPRETNFQNFLQSIPMSPMIKNMTAAFPMPWPAVYTGDGSFWS